MLSILLRFAPLLIGLVASGIAITLHNYWSKGEGWYATSDNHFLKAAIGLIITTVIAMFGSQIPMLSGVVTNCTPTADNVLGQACLDAIGGIFSKTNVAVILGALITLFTHTNASIAKVHRNLMALGTKQGAALER